MTRIPQADTNQCMLCRHSEYQFIHKLRDDDTRNVYKCVNCGHVQVVPLPTPEEDNEFYQSGKMYERIFAVPEENKNEEKMVERLRRFAEYPAEKLMEFLCDDWRILEIGCAYGWLLEKLQNHGYDIEGVEISDKYRDLYHKRTGKELLSFNFLTMNSDVLAKHNSYDCIVLIHTLEHISDPIMFILRAATLLKPGGKIYIEVPNENDYMLKHSDKYADHNYRRAHLSYFDPQTLTRLLEQCGFENIEIHGNQLFSPENASQWLRYNKPFYDYHQIELPEPIQWLNKIYKDRLEANLESYAIIGTGQKKGVR